MNENFKPQQLLNTNTAKHVGVVSFTARVRILTAYSLTNDHNPTKNVIIEFVSLQRFLCA